MKLLIVCLVAACLHFVAVSANVEVSPSSSFIEGDDSPTDYEYNAYDLAEDITDTETNVIISWIDFYFVTRRALSFTRGVKCIVGKVHEVRNACVTFLTNTTQCSGDLNAEVRKLVTTCENIANTASSIIRVNERVCDNTNGNNTNPNNTVEMLNVKTSIKCFFCLFPKTIKLTHQIRSAIRLIKEIPNVPGQTNQCANTAVQNLGNVLNAYPGNVTHCSSLSKN